MSFTDFRPEALWCVLLIVIHLLIAGVHVVDDAGPRRGGGERNCLGSAMTLDFIGRVSDVRLKSPANSL